MSDSIDFATYFVERLKQCGVKYVFGVPGVRIPSFRSRWRSAETRDIGLQSRAARLYRG